MGKRREPDIFDDNPLTEDFLEWMVSPDGQTAGEVSGLVFATLENASVDAKRRKVIWADGERLSIEQSAERIHAEHPDRPRELIEISLCSWFEHRVPESGSERQINELDRLFGPWIRDRERKARAAKKWPRSPHSQGRRLTHGCCHGHAFASKPIAIREALNKDWLGCT